MSDLDEILAKIEADPRLWWDLFQRIPPVLGPWVKEESQAANTSVTYSRNFPGGMVAATVTFYKPGFRVVGKYKQAAGGWRAAIRSSERADWGLVDFRHSVETPEEGMDLIDEELRRQGVLLVT